LFKVNIDLAIPVLDVKQIAGANASVGEFYTFIGEIDIPLNIVIICCVGACATWKNIPNTPMIVLLIKLSK